MHLNLVDWIELIELTIESLNLESLDTVWHTNDEAGERNWQRLKELNSNMPVFCHDTVFIRRKSIRRLHKHQWRWCSWVLMVGLQSRVPMRPHLSFTSLINQRWHRLWPITRSRWDGLPLFFHWKLLLPLLFVLAAVFQFSCLTLKTGSTSAELKTGVNCGPEEKRKNEVLLIWSHSVLIKSVDCLILPSAGGLSVRRCLCVCVCKAWLMTFCRGSSPTPLQITASLAVIKKMEEVAII